MPNSLSLVPSSSADLPPLVECELLRASGSFVVSLRFADETDYLLELANAARKSGLPLNCNFHLTSKTERVKMMTEAQPPKH